MVPLSFHDYFLASCGSGGALIGLLFVAVTIAPERALIRAPGPEREMVAASTFTALVNAFFVSFIALLPGVNLGAIALVMGVLNTFPQNIAIC